MSKFQIQRYGVTVNIPVGTATGASTAAALNGLLKGVIAIVPNLSSTNTLTVAVKDADGTTIFSKAAMAESTTSASFVDANNQPLELPLSGDHTIAVTSSGNETPTVNIPVVLLIQRG